ncbi:ATP-dependent helicase dcl2-2 [Aspergillus uvarum CBS 121591]|uniref:ATP-dependent helicase dcl2-2 n=1 Tax=Aspergillus uvarum CBS 121591 TaxID=1448315 RepID=A0A319CTT9_9EURO|nr:ATP-dependent helicase dcl2-2 [Aspergillus uvarum CBS 121591]PYH86157.1 ATP-dependent helicase dcl2-2 [Aspergillus uvarum CBS 121591]
MASSTGLHMDSTLEAEDVRNLLAREYQLEMLHESLRQNIIVVTPTGTGKTQIAILRILAEIDKGDREKFCWILCPTVALCEQHVQTMRTRLPPTWCRSFTGGDKVDHWKSKEIWEDALSGVRVAISTYQVLYDALQHAYLNIHQLSLLIFDEAHHCVKSNAANRIMREFYHKRVNKSVSCGPYILGLTASPILSELSCLEVVEKNLDSICRTPRRHYGQLLQFANKPMVLPRQPPPSPVNRHNKSIVLISLSQLLKAHEGIDYQEKIDAKRLNEITRFLKCAEALNHELGSWPATNYMLQSISYFKSRMRMHAEKSTRYHPGKEYAMEIFCQLGNLEAFSSEIRPEDVSPNCMCLLTALQEEYSKEFRGLIFVTQRATVLAMKWLIETHPLVRDLFRCGTFIGMSTAQPSKTELGNLHEINSQSETLHRFHEGSLNLIITTDALEEGIDIPDCNTVFNFNCHLSLKSYIQRRGRARKKHAKFIVIAEDEALVQTLKQLEQQENELAQTLQEERLISAHVMDTENLARDALHFYIETTGAKLTMPEAIRHLFHFCSNLPAQPHVSNKPIFRFETLSSGQIRGFVMLPNSMDPSLHQFTSSCTWLKRKHAKEDAALQAYKALFDAGLVNDHLVPTTSHEILDMGVLAQSHYTIQGQLNPWHELGRLWSSNQTLYSHELRIKRSEGIESRVFIILSSCITETISIPLFEDSETSFTALVSSGHPVSIDISLCQKVTELIMQSVHRNRASGDCMNFPFGLVPEERESLLVEFLESYSGTTSLAQQLSKNHHPNIWGLLRKSERHSRPQKLESWDQHTFKSSDSSEASTEVKAKIKPLTRRRNFLQSPSATHRASTIPATEIRRTPEMQNLFIEELSVDKLPSRFAEVALLVPSIFHEIGMHWSARTLQRHIYSKFEMTQQGIQLLKTAIDPLNIEDRSTFRRLVFIGDMIMNFLISRQLFLHQTLWHEGLLSQSKHSIVSDQQLARTVSRTGLDKFLVTTCFNGRKWVLRMLSMSLADAEPSPPRQVGIALLAALAKALAGSAFLANGLEQAATYLAVIVPRIKTWNVSSLYDGVYLNSRRSCSTATAMDGLEQLLEYRFTDKSLAVEAMTHPSYIGISATSSYGRLSFLGASVLDWIIVSSLIHTNVASNTKRLQSVRAALLNNTFLTFICLMFYTEGIKSDIQVDDNHNARTITRTYSIHLWHFLRSNSNALSEQISTLVHRSSKKVDLISQDLWGLGPYPWARLSDLGNIEALSSIIQSIFGAIYIDSKATEEACMGFAERLNILPLLRHLTSRQIETDHPKDALQVLLSGHKISYDIHRNEEIPMALRCRLLVDGSEVMIVEGQMNRDAITTLAAEKAIHLVSAGSIF